MKKTICVILTIIFTMMFANSSLTASATDNHVSKDNMGGEICSEFEDAKEIVSEAYGLDVENVKLFQYTDQTLFDAWEDINSTVIFFKFSEEDPQPVAAYGTSPDNIFCVKYVQHIGDLGYVDNFYSLTEDELLNQKMSQIVEAIDKQVTIGIATSNKSSTKIFIVFFAIIIFVAIIVLFLYFVSSGNKKDEHPENETRPSRFSPDTIIK